MHAQSPAQVDVVIPTRNRGALIEAAITSILASDYTAFTLWVVDQSDNDATEQTVLGFARADSRVRYLRLASHGNSGLDWRSGCRAEPAWRRGDLWPGAPRVFRAPARRSGLALDHHGDENRDDPYGLRGQPL